MCGVHGQDLKECQREEGVWLGNFRVLCLLFADHVVLLASLNHDLQHALGLYASKGKTVGMQVSSSKSKSMVLNGNRVECSL